MNNNFIGFFDSGIGGTSVLSEAKKLLPNEKFLYISDRDNMPYGEKTQAEIYFLAKTACGQLAEKGAKAIVIACNTVTGVCISKLRENFDIPIVAIEPAIAKAKRLYDKNILVIATSLTVKQKNFQKLLCTYGRQNFEVIADKNLARIIEYNYDNKQNLSRLLKAELDNYPKNKSAIVLGCTHYVLAKDLFSHYLAAPTVDGNAETARQLMSVLSANRLLRE